MIQFPDTLQNLNLERSILSAFIKYPNSLLDLKNFREKEFSHPIHSTLFCVIRNVILDGKKIEIPLISQKLLDLQIRKFGDIDIHQYLENLWYVQVNPNGVNDIASELVKLRIRREIYSNANEVMDYVKEVGNDKAIGEIISHVDYIYNNQTNQYDSDCEPKDLYGDIEKFITDIAKNPIEECGLITPFNQWNKWFGGLISGDGSHIICSRSGEGKSCFMFNLAKGVSKLNNCKILIIDTEMSLDLNMFRAAAAEGDINSWYLRTGKWIKHPELHKKVLGSFPKLNDYKGSIYHIYAPNKNIQEILNIIKRWYFKIVGRGNKCLIIYDYLKITSDLDKNRQEWQQLGDKISYLNEIGAKLNCPIFSAAQQNRSALDQYGKRYDESLTVGASDRINQYACFNAIFRQKELDEISEHGNQYGTHLLKPIKYSRTQGKEDYNVHSRVRVVDPHGKIKYYKNFINYEIRNYAVVERGTLSDIVITQQLNANLQGDNHNHMGDTEI